MSDFTIMIMPPYDMDDVTAEAIIAIIDRWRLGWIAGQLTRLQPPAVCSLGALCCADTHWNSSPVAAAMDAGCRDFRELGLPKAFINGLSHGNDGEPSHAGRYIGKNARPYRQGYEVGSGVRLHYLRKGETQ